MRFYPLLSWLLDEACGCILNGLRVLRSGPQNELTASRRVRGMRMDLGQYKLACMSLRRADAACALVRASDGRCIAEYTPYAKLSVPSRMFCSSISCLPLSLTVVRLGVCS